jgi:hypothetical protein
MPCAQVVISLMQAGNAKNAAKARKMIIENRID